MAGAKIPTQRRKKRSRSTSRPTSISIRSVRRSSSPSASEAAAILGVSAATLRRRAQRGEIRAVVDAQGHYHFPVAVRPTRAAAAARAAKKKLLGSKKSPVARPAKKTPVRKTRAYAATAATAAHATKKKLLGSKKSPVAHPAKKPASLRKKHRASPIATPAAVSAPSTTSSTSRKKKLVGRKPSKLAKKSKKTVTREKKVVRGKVPSPSPRKKKKLPGKKRGAPSRLQFQPIPRVRQSAAPTLKEAAKAFGVSPRTLLDWVLVKKVRGVIDDLGTIHIPALDLQLRELAVRAGLESDRLARKKARKKRRAKKSKRPRRPAPAGPPRRPAGWVMGPFGVFIPPIDAPLPAEPSRENPMDVGLAAQRMGNVTRDYVMARLAIDRELTYQDYRAMKHAFRTTYGVKVWRDTFDWIVDEWGLMDYIFDYEALRDS